LVYIYKVTEVPDAMNPVYVFNPDCPCIFRSVTDLL